MVCTGSYLFTQTDIDAGKVDNTVTADSDEVRPRHDDETVTLPQIPVISIVKTGTWVDGDAEGEPGYGYADPGELINYTLTATNDGNVTLTGVTVVDTKASPLVCTIDTVPATSPFALAAGKAVVCTGNYTLTQTDIDAGKVDNTATADSDESDPATMMRPSRCPKTRSSPSSRPAPGWMATPRVSPVRLRRRGRAYQLHLRRDQRGQRDPHRRDGRRHGRRRHRGRRPVHVDVGETDKTTFTARYAITQADIDPGYFANTATADSAESDPADGSEDVSLPQNPAISIVKTGTCRRRRRGSTTGPTRASSSTTPST